MNSMNRALDSLRKSLATLENSDLIPRMYPSKFLVGLEAECKSWIRIITEDLEKDDYSGYAIGCANTIEAIVNDMIEAL